MKTELSSVKENTNLCDVLNAKQSASSFMSEDSQNVCIDNINDSVTTQCTVLVSDNCDHMKTNIEYVAKKLPSTMTIVPSSNHTELMPKQLTRPSKLSLNLTTIPNDYDSHDGINLPKLSTASGVVRLSSGDSQYNQPSTSSTTSSLTTSNPAPKYIKKHDIGFNNLSYTVKTGILKREQKTILTNLNGKFKAGDLTAIMGPSGAGKSSLLNILSGYTIQNICGEITVNDCKRDLKRFLHQSAFIAQDHGLQPYLTVNEAMHFSVNLKIGNELSTAQKKERTRQILEAIGMKESGRTRTMNLSGGQKKRLGIALELVNNPPVLFLDEPTSGLDSSTTTQCVSLLKKLAEEGRTVICTIHQPSALVFGMFDHLFAIADGRCIYSGGTENVLPFLAELNLKCPESYNPSDYLLEISTNDYGQQNDRLNEKINNGKCDLYRKDKTSRKQMEAMGQIERMMESGLITPVKAPEIIDSHPLTEAASPTLTPILEMASSTWGSSGLAAESTTVTYSKPYSEAKGLLSLLMFPFKSQKSQNSQLPQHQTHLSAKEKASSIKILKIKPPNLQIDPSKLCKQGDRYALSFWRQLSLLLMRTFLILWRDRSLTRTRLIIHAVMAIFVGILYFQIGNDANHMLNNFRYIFFSIMFLMFTTFSATTLNFPLEFPIVSREHFNRWYSLRAYYVAITLADVPIQLCCTSIFIGITYLLTNQPLELFRVMLFFTMCMMACMVSQSIGLVVGASLDVKNGAVFGPFFICPFLIFSGFFVQMRDVPSVMHWLFHMSFLKHALEGSVVAIFGYDREKMDCTEIFCFYSRPQKFLKDLNMDKVNYLIGVLALTGIFFTLRFLAFYIMSFRLNLRR